MPKKSDGFFFAEGARCVTSILASPMEIASVVVIKEKRVQSIESVVSLAAGRGIEIVEIAEKHARKYFDSKTPQGIGAVVAKPRARSVDELLSGAKRVLVLDGVNDPGNAGTILRTACLLGWDAVITIEGSVSLFNAKAVRASAGAIGFIGVGESNATEIMKRSAARGFRMAVTSASAGDDRAPRDVEKLILVLGGEARGAQSPWKAEYSVTIPMKAMPIDSLGVVASGAMLLERFRPK